MLATLWTGSQLMRATIISGDRHVTLKTVKKCISSPACVNIQLFEHCNTVS